MSAQQKWVYLFFHFFFNSSSLPADATLGKVVRGEKRDQLKMCFFFSRLPLFRNSSALILFLCWWEIYFFLVGGSSSENKKERVGARAEEILVLMWKLETLPTMSLPFTFSFGGVVCALGFGRWCRFPLYHHHHRQCACVLRVGPFAKVKLLWGKNFLLYFLFREKKMLLSLCSPFTSSFLWLTFRVWEKHAVFCGQFREREKERGLLLM